MNRAIWRLLLLICLVGVQLSSSQDHLKLKKLTSDLISAIAEANSGKKYGSQWVPSLGKALEEVYTTSSRRCFLFRSLTKKVETLCPKPPTYLPSCYPCAKPKPKPKPKPPPPSRAKGPEFHPPPHPSYELVYPDGTYFPWCYMPFCPTICQPPYCYPCILPNCDPKCVPPWCYPPCKPPACQLPPTCWQPFCPDPCVFPRCIPGNSEKSVTPSCVAPYCPPPIDCSPPYCPKMIKPVTNKNVNIISLRTGMCPMRDILRRVESMG
ncbi:uncharacterized protein LOC128255752 [Drosophila gunungcola]|uniref:uncharacterized protein LOC128255752 n=1 Tax=Drosophila gunungcola TaxID=103775 RepID=UPI0022DEEBB4|nr:uncharacterized protein LOC128255752 [Drosophila gunungcola]